MTESIGHSVSSSAGFRSAGRQHVRSGEEDAAAFDEALAKPKPKPARADAGPSAKLGANGRAWHRAELRPGPAATAFDGPAEVASRPSSGPDIGHPGALPDDTDAKADEADAQSELTADQSIGNGLPMQLRAEQAIAAIMTLSRQTEANGPAREAPEAGRGVEAESAMQGAPAPDGDDTPPVQHMAERGKSSSLVATAPLQSSAPAVQARPKVQPEVTAERASQPSRPTAATAAPISALLTRPAAAASAQSAAKPEQRQQGVATAAKAASGNGVQPARPAETTAAAVETATAAEKPVAVSSSIGADTRQDASRDTLRGDPMPAPASISVIAERAAPAPAAPSLSANGAAIVNAIRSDKGWSPTQHSSSASHAAGANSAQPMRSLKIQLHPAELGMVTAQLRNVGDQLSVELQVDSHEAYHRLTADSDAIIKSLRSLGFDIDRVSIQQPQAAAATVARTDAAAARGSFAGDTPSFQPGNSGNGGERFGGQTGNRGHGSGGHGSEKTAQPIDQNRVGSGLYI